MAVATRLADQPRSAFVGTYSGTTAAQNIHIGFKPSFMIAVNVTDGNVVYIWSKLSATTVVVISDAGCSETATATGTIAIAAVDNGTVLGFSLPACDTVVNENSKVYLLFAVPE